MNAAKAKKSPAKVKGAVLIMILAVMTVMIILLAGSIAVVYSAHNRAAVKYSESQGYYTARSVLDNFFAELSESTDQKDSTNTSIGTYYQLDLKNNTVVSKPLCIGRSIELELYKPNLEVYSGGSYADWFVEYCDANKGALGAQLNGFLGNSTDYTAGSDGSNTTLYSDAAKYYVNLNKSALADYSTFSSFYNQYVSVTATGDGADTVTYEIESLDGFGSGTIDTDGDGSPDTSMQFGKLSDTGASKAWITVQVTERIFAMGEGTTYAERFKNGKRSEDHIVAKVTAHVIYDGEEMTTTQIWVSSPPPVVDADTGLSSLGPINDSASITGVGDVATLTQTLSKFSNDPTFSGNVFFDGSLEHNNTDATATLEDGEVFFVGGTYKTSVNNFKGVNSGSVFYANRFQLWSNNSFTAGNVPVNIIANTFETHSSQKKVYGRIFAETFDTMSSGSTITYPNSTSKSNISGGGMLFEANNTQIYGDVYCNYLGVPADRVYAVVDTATTTITLKINYKGDGNTIVSGDVNRVENMVGAGNKIYVYKGIRIINGVESQPIAKDEYGNNVPGLVNRYETYNAGGVDRTDFTVGEQFTFPEADTFLNFGGDSLVSGYTIKVDFGNTNNVIVDKTSSGAKLNVNYYAAKSDNVWTLNDKYYKEFTLPSGVSLLGSSDSKFSLPTHRSIYGNYFFKEISSGTTAALYPKTFDEDTGAFSMSTADNDFPTFLQEHAITAEAILAGVDVNTPVDIVNIPEMSFMTTPVTIGSGGGDTVNGVYMPASSNVISSSGYIAPPSGNAYNSFKSTIHYIDARSSDLDIQLGDGVNPVEMAGAFIVYGDNHVTVTIPGVNGGGNAQTVKLGSNGAKFIFATEEIFSGASKDNFVIGEGISSINGGATTTSPNIDWYFSKNIAQADVATGGGINGAPSKSNETTLCGYINAPTVFFNIDTNANGIERATYYYKDRIQPSSNEKYTICGSIFCRQYTGGQHAGVCFIPRDNGYVDDGSKPLLNKNGMYRSRR